jgi:hypothetical protein
MKEDDEPTRPWLHPRPPVHSAGAGEFALGMVMIVAIPQLCRRLHIPLASDSIHLEMNGSLGSIMNLGAERPEGEFCGTVSCDLGLFKILS